MVYELRVTWCFQPTVPRPENLPTPEDLNNVKFWVQMIALMSWLIEEDKTQYSPIICQLVASFSVSISFTTPVLCYKKHDHRFPSEVNVGHLSATTLWIAFTKDMSFALQKHQEQQQCKSAEYINLCFQIQMFYDKYIKDVPNMKDIGSLVFSFFKILLI